MRSIYICRTLVFLVVLWAASGCKKEDVATEARAMEPTNCAHNLEIIARGKQLWAENNHKGQDDTPTMAELTVFIRHAPTCPSGGTYTIGKVGESPSCSIPEHNQVFKKLGANP